MRTLFFCAATTENNRETRATAKKQLNLYTWPLHPPPPPPPLQTLPCLPTSHCTLPGNLCKSLPPTPFPLFLFLSTSNKTRKSSGSFQAPIKSFNIFFHSVNSGFVAFCSHQKLDWFSIFLHVDHPGGKKSMVRN